MSLFRGYSKMLAFSLVLITFGAFSATVSAEDVSDELSLLAENSVIHAGVIAALEQDVAADVIVTMNLPPIETSRYAHHPAAKSDVHPLLFDLVMMAEPGTPRIEEAGSGVAFHARMSVAALRALGDNQDILAIELDPNPEVGEGTGLGELTDAIPSKLHCPCFGSTSTLACLQNKRWRVENVTHGGSASKRVNAPSDVSAVWWTFGSSNWEILTKVINACSFNGKWWVLAAGASSVSYNFQVTDASFCPNFKTYSSTSWGNPVLDTAAFNCP